MKNESNTQISFKAFDTFYLPLLTDCGYNRPHKSDETNYMDAV